MVQADARDRIITRSLQMNGFRQNPRSLITQLMMFCFDFAGTVRDGILNLLRTTNTVLGASYLEYGVG